MRLGRGGVGDVGGVDLAKNGEPADERDALGFVHLDAAEHDGVVTHVDLGREHGLIAARGDKADAREYDARGNKPARHGEVNLLLRWSWYSLLSTPRDTRQQPGERRPRRELLILDELGYVPLDIEGARLLFQVMSVPEGRLSMIVTANIEFSKWVTVFGDDKMAAAVVDRLVYTGRLVEFNGASCRIESRVLCCLLVLSGH